MALRPSTNTAYDNTATTSGTIKSSYYDSTKYVPELYSKKVLRKN